MDSNKKKMAKLAEVMKNSPRNSGAFKKAMKELDELLGMPSEPISEGEEYDDERESEAD